MSSSENEWKNLPDAHKGAVAPYAPGQPILHMSLIHYSSMSCQASATADHVSSTGHKIKWDHFEILTTGRSDIHCRINESSLIKDLKPS